MVALLNRQPFLLIRSACSVARLVSKVWMSYLQPFPPHSSSLFFAFIRHALKKPTPNGFSYDSVINILSCIVRGDEIRS